MSTQKRVVKRLGLVAMAITIGLLGLGGLAPTATSQAASPVQVTFFAAPDATIVNLDTNWYTKYVEKKYNMRIKWTLAPLSDVATKATVLLNSGDYPDVFYNARSCSMSTGQE